MKHINYVCAIVQLLITANLHLILYNLKLTDYIIILGRAHGTSLVRIRASHDVQLSTAWTEAKVKDLSSDVHDVYQSYITPMDHLQL